MVMAQQSPSCSRWWSHVGGVLQKKKEHTYRGNHLPWRKKKGRKKKGKKEEEVPSTSIYLANFDLIVWWFHPLRHSGINWDVAFNFSKLKPTRRSLEPYTKTKTILPHYNQEIIRTSGQTDKRSVLFFLHVAIRNSLRSNKNIARCTHPDVNSFFCR